MSIINAFGIDCLRIVLINHILFIFDINCRVYACFCVCVNERAVPFSMLSAVCIVLFSLARSLFREISHWSLFLFFLFSALQAGYVD